MGFLLIMKLYYFFGKKLIKLSEYNKKKFLSNNLFDLNILLLVSMKHVLNDK